jgi:cellulose biosynthesis protein BcsQ
MNPNIKLLGYFFNRVKANTGSAKQFIPTARENIPEVIAEVNGGNDEGKFFDTVIRDSEDVRKAVILHSAVTERFRSNKVGKDFEKLYYEVTEALENE